MAKVITRYWYILLLCVIGSGCVSESGVDTTDTPPDVENSTALHNVIPIQEATPDTAVEFVKVGKKIERQITVTPLTYTDYQSAVQKVYTRNIGVRELTGKNDGVSIAVFLASVGLKPPDPYCAAYVHFCLERGGVRNSITGWSPTALNRNNLVLSNRNFIKPPKAADVVVFYYPQLKRIGHTGFFDREINSSVYESVEANTGDGGAIGEIVREGQGVYRKKRSYNATFAISRFIKE